MIRPHKVSENPHIGLITPGSKPIKSQLGKGIANLKKLGFEISEAPGSKTYAKRFGDSERLKSITWAFSKPYIDLVMATRGGYGSLRILDKIDYNMIRRSQKILIGYSDLTALSLAILKQTGMITFAGPMAASHFSKPLSKITRQSFLNTINGDYHKGTRFDLKSMGAKTINKGFAEGRLVGGNLTILTRMIGSQYLPDMKNAILFLEDIDEHAGRLDNMFAQLRLSGILHKISAVIFGQYRDCFPGSTTKQTRQLAKLAKDYLQELNIPALYDLPFGHVRRILTLPIGLPVSLDAARGTLTYLENPVAC
jgi:muramoyltetrapeptide carboxypeptidase